MAVDCAIALLVSTLLLLFVSEILGSMRGCVRVKVGRHNLWNTRGLFVPLLAKLDKQHEQDSRACVFVRTHMHIAHMLRLAIPIMAYRLEGIEGKALPE
jgi:hypothetical protein